MLSTNIAFVRVAKFLGNNFSTKCSDTIASLLQNGKVGDKINIKVIITLVSHPILKLNL